MNETLAQHAVIFVPGFSPAATPSTMNQIDDFLQILQVDRGSAQPTTCGSVQGYRFKDRRLNCDVFMASWNDRLDRLSSKPTIFRVLRVTYLALIGIPVWWREQTSHSSPAFRAQTTAGLFALFAFLYLTIAGILSQFSLTQHPTLAAIFDIHKSWFIALTALFAASGIASGDIADVVDAYDRYLTDPMQLLRDRLRRHVGYVIDQVTSAGYADVTVVAHSMGALLAIDATPDFAQRDVDLVTFGASFGYLFDLQPTETKALIVRCSVKVPRWTDVTSTNDPVASGVSSVDPRLENIERRVPLSSTFWDYVSAGVHSAYFNCTALREIIEPHVSASASAP